MKKIIRNTLFSILLAFTALPFVSCGYEPVFYGIMNDVEPEEATVSGNITSIVRCTISSEEYLVLSTGGSLLYKPLNVSKHGEWKGSNIKVPFSYHHYNYFATSSEGEGHHGQQILRVISDTSNLYLLTTDFIQDNDYGVVLPNKIYLWTCTLDSLFSNDAAIWTNIATDENMFKTVFDSSTSSLLMYFRLFYTNTPKPEHRKAFLSVTNSEDTTQTSYYILKGAAAPEVQETTNYVKTDEKSERVRSAFYVGDTLYFSDSQIVATNETAQSNATVAVINGVNENGVASKNLFSYKGTDAATKFLEAGSPVASLAFTADSLIIGKGSYSSSFTSDGGIERVLLDENGDPLTTKTDFENNAKYQFTSSYIIMNLLCADPTKKEAEADLYASISFRGSNSSSTASFNNVGLWSYYPSRGNWNRE